jgi:preprotein translocase subunit YajC
MESITGTIAGKLIEFGLLGVIVLVLGFYIVRKDKEHREEREKLASSLKDTNDKMLTAFDRNTTVLTEVKTLIQTLRP